VDKEPEDDDQGDQGRNAKFQDASKTVNVIFGGDGDFGSRREQKQLSQAGLEIPSRKASKSSIQSTGDVALKSIQL
jgi:hypothetical protein